MSHVLLAVTLQTIKNTKMWYLTVGCLVDGQSVVYRIRPILTIIKIKTKMK